MAGRYRICGLVLLVLAAGAVGEELRIIPSELTGHPEIFKLNTDRAIIEITGEWKTTYDKKIRLKEYRRHVNIPATWAGKRVILWVDDAAAVLEINVNGKAVGKYIHADHLSGSVDITSAIKPGKNNELVLRQFSRDLILQKSKIAGKQRKEFITPALYNYHEVIKSEEQRILGKIFLIAVNTPFIRAVRYRISLDKKIVTLVGQLVNRGDKRTVQLKAELSEIGIHDEPKLALLPSGGVVSTSKTVKINLPKDKADIPFTLKIPFPANAKLWKPKQPFLYLFKVICTESGKTVDSYADRLGLRTFGIKGPNFTLNGKRFQPRLTFGGHYTDHGGWNLERVYSHIIQVHRKLKYNLYRTHGWPRARCYYLLADQIGAPTICESAVAFGSNYPIEDTEHRFWDDYLTHVRRLVEQRGNNPSIMIWSAENEILSQPRIVDKTGKIHKRLGEINRIFKQMDPKRPLMFEGDLDIHGQCETICEHYPKRYGKSLWPTDFYWVDKPHAMPHADGSYHFKTMTWKRDKPYIFGETFWFPGGGPVQHTPFVGDKEYEYFMHYPHAGWRVEDGFSPYDMASRAYNLQDVSAFVIQSSTAVLDDVRRRSNNPLAVFIKEEFRHYFSGEKLERDYVVCSTLQEDCNLELRAKIVMANKAVSEVTIKVPTPAGERKFGNFALKMPIVSLERKAQLVTELWRGEHLCDRTIHSLKIFPRIKKHRFFPGHICVFDPIGPTLKIFERLGANPYAIDHVTAESLKNVDLLVIGPGVLNSKVKLDKAVVSSYVKNGGKVLVLEQKAGADFSFLEVPLVLTKNKSATMAHVITQHPMLAGRGLEQGDFHWWHDDHFVARACFRKPQAGNTRCILEVGDGGGLKYTPLVEIFNGKGTILLSQLACIEKFDTAPIAGKLLGAATEYLLTRNSSMGRLGVIAPAKATGSVKAILKRLDLAAVNYTLLAGKDLTEGRIRRFSALIVPPDAKSLEIAFNNYDAITDWVYREGGKVILHRMDPKLAKGVNKLVYPNNVVFTKPRKGVFRKPLYKIVRDDPLITGLSNETFWWIPTTARTKNVFKALEKPLIDYDVRQNPGRRYGNRWIVLTEPAGLVRLKFGLGEFIFDQVCWDIRESFLGKQLRYLRLLMTNCGVSVGAKPKSAVDISSMKTVSLNIKPLCNMGFTDAAAQDGKGGGFDMGPQLDLRNISTGRHVLGGVPFEIIDPAANKGKSCIVLFGSYGESFPKKVGPVAVNAKFNYLAFHHASAYAKSGNVIGTYVVHYADGKDLNVKIVEGKHVMDWYNGPNRMQAATPAWSGQTQKGITVATYSYLWKNPQPKVAIKGITIHAGDPTMGMMEGVLSHGMMAVVSITGISAR